MYLAQTAVVFCLVVAGVSGRSYPVRLSNNGPKATTIPIINKHVRTPVIERMPLRTLGCIPRPKTIDNVCTCFKTILKPLVHNQIISVPSVQRVIQTAATPVIEKIHYEATPVDSPQSYPGPYSQFPSRFATFSSLPFGFVPFRSNCPSLVTVPNCVCTRNPVVC